MDRTAGHRFTDAERAAYDRDGYVVRERSFDAGEVAAIIHDCEGLVDEIVRERRGRRAKAGSYVFESNVDLGMIIKWEGDSDVVHGLEPFAHVSASMNAWALDPRFVDPMKDICGDEAPALFTEKLNLKRPHVGGRNPLHQDYPYWLDASETPLRLATAMMFLDDATLQNGCLQVIAGSPDLGVQAMRTDSDEFGNNEMDARPFATTKLVPLEVPAGSVVYFGPLLVHMSEMNTSDRERRALLFSYGPSSQRHLSDILIEKMRPASQASV